MSNSVGSPSTLWGLGPAIYGVAQIYIASETSTQPRMTTQTPQTVDENLLSYPDYDWILEYEDITRRRCANTSKLALSAT